MPRRSARRPLVSAAATLAAHGVDHELHVFHKGRHGLSLATPEASKGPAYESAHVARWLDFATEWLAELRG